MNKARVTSDDWCDRARTTTGCMAFVGSDTERPYDSLVALLQLAQVAAETDASPKQPVSSPKPVTAQPKAPNAAAGRPMPECPVLADPDGTTRGKKVRPSILVQLSL
eukprot:SAG31_NODE_1561_length_7872_cov_2.787469_2_plen_107_part_00